MKRLVIDSETTGLSPRKHQILTLGMSLIDVDHQKLRFIEDKHIFFRHDEYRISKTAMLINGINLEEHHRIALPVNKAIKEINNFIEKNKLADTVILGHNLQFDKGFICSLFEEGGHCYPFCENKEDTRYIWDRLKRKGLVDPLKNSKLGTLAEHFKIDYSNAHDALADCQITAKVYHEMLKLSPII